jgi:hypothetical protein
MLSPDVQNSKPIRCEKVFVIDRDYSKDLAMRQVLIDVHESLRLAKLRFTRMGCRTETEL